LSFWHTLALLVNFLNKEASLLQAFKLSSPSPYPPNTLFFFFSMVPFLPSRSTAATYDRWSVAAAEMISFLLPRFCISLPSLKNLISSRPFFFSLQYIHSDGQTCSFYGMRFYTEAFFWKTLSSSSSFSPLALNTTLFLPPSELFLVLYSPSLS